MKGCRERFRSPSRFGFSSRIPVAQAGSEASIRA
jgi:hypothetical protein